MGKTKLKKQEHNDLQNANEIYQPQEIVQPKFDYNLPAGVNDYLDRQKQNPNKLYSENLLKDIFAEKNKKYVNGTKYKKDLLALEKENTGGQGAKRLSYKKRMNLEYKLASVNYSKVISDSKTFVKIVTFGFGGDNKAMVEIKRRLNIVQRFISGDISQFKIGEHEYDVNRFKDVTTEVFEGAIDACKNYTATHSSSPKTVWGKRRLSQVSGILDQLEKDYIKYKEAVSELETGSYDDHEELKSPEDLVEKIDFIEINDVEHMTEGNSTEVYKGKVKEVNEDGKEVDKTYYIKENLPLLHKNMDGFLKRRIKELDISLKLKKKDPKTLAQYGERTEKEEARMKKAHADEQDYKNGTNLLETIQSIINNSSVNERNLVRRKYAMFFKHDFDRIFAELLQYNNAMKLLEQNTMKSISEWEKEAKSKNPDPKAVVIYNLLKQRGVKNAAEAKGAIKEKSASEWIIEKLDVKDKSISRLLKEIDKQKDNPSMRVEGKKASRIETLFRITMGKEVELYGQIMEKNQLEDNEMSQYNTLATSYLGDNYGFRNEVVSTKIKKGAFPRWTGEKTQNSITMQEVAEGIEWIDLIKKNRPIKLSPNAVKQLTRLQMFDTLCMQIDRHGRNFKCQYDENPDGSFTVKSIKAYDHDQSFSASTLADSFEEKRGKDNKLIEAKNNRFLPSLMKVVKKDTPMYRYLAGKYFNTSLYDTRWMKKQKEEPIKDYGKYGFNDRGDREISEIELTNIQKDLILTGFYGGPTQGKGDEQRPIVTGAVNFTFKKGDNESYKKTYSGSIHKNSVLRKRGTNWTERDNEGNPLFNDVEKYYNNVRERVNSKGYFEYDDIEYNPKVKEVIDKVMTCIDTLGDFFINKKMTDEKAGTKYKVNYEEYKGMYNVKTYFRDSKSLNNDKEGLKKAAEAIRELKILNNEYDFSDIIVKVSNIGSCLNKEGYKIGVTDFFHNFGGYSYSGLLQAYIDQTLYMFASSFANVEEVQKIMNKPAEVSDDMNFFMNENGDLVMPNMLHMDQEAYNSIQRMVNDFGPDGKGQLYWELKKKHLTDPAIQSIYERAKEMLNRIDNEVKPAAEKFLSIMYRDDVNDPRRKFFLSGDDYNNCNSLYDMALDPGDTYLVQDNKHFIACDREFASYMSDAEKENTLNERNAVVTHPKRWNGTAEKKLETNIRSRIDK